MANTVITGPILDSFGQPANGYLYGEQTARQEVDGALVTAVRVKARVIEGVPFLDDGVTPLSVPSTPTGEALVWVEDFRNFDTQTVRATIIPEAGPVAYASLQDTVKPIFTTMWIVPGWARDIGGIGDEVNAALAIVENAVTNIGTIVSAEIADQDIPAQVQSQVTADVAGRDLVEGSDIRVARTLPTPGYAWQLVSLYLGKWRRSWLGVKDDGGVPDYTVKALMAVSGSGFSQYLSRIGRSWAVLSRKSNGQLVRSSLALMADGTFSPETKSEVRRAARRPTSYWGDSMTRPNGYTNDYPAVMSGLDGVARFNPAVAGEAPSDTSFRGGVPILLTGVASLPASGSLILPPNQVTPSDGWRLDATTNGSGVSNQVPPIGVYTGVEVCGVQFTLTRYQLTENGVQRGYFKFDRVSAGSLVPLPPGQPVIAHIPGAAAHKDDFHIFADGRNLMDADIIVREYDRRIAWFGHDSYMVIPPTMITTSEVGTWRRIVETLAGRYRGHFFNHIPWMIDNAMDFMGLTWTSDDRDDQTNRLVPRSLRADVTHFNTAGVVAQGYICHQARLDLGLK